MLERLKIIKSLNIPLKADHAALHIDRRVDDFKAHLTIAMHV